MIQTNQTSPESILQRIDAIIAELQQLRHSVVALQAVKTAEVDLVEQLVGSLGQGTWEEYDRLLDWERFSE